MENNTLMEKESLPSLVASTQAESLITSKTGDHGTCTGVSKCEIKCFWGMITVIGCMLLLVGILGIVLILGEKQKEPSFFSRFILAPNSYFNVSIEQEALADRYSALNYTIFQLTDSGGNNDKQISVIFKLNYLRQEFKNESYAKENVACYLKHGVLDPNCFILRYWPQGFQQSGNISCHVEAEKDVYFVWKWVSFDEKSIEYEAKDFFDQIDCSELIEDTPEKWPKCPITFMDINSQILKDRNSNLKKEFIIMTFCSESYQPVVHYTVLFTEQWLVDIGPYNQYRVNITRDEYVNSVLVPITNNDDIHIEANSDDIQPIILKQEGVPKASYVKELIRNKYIECYIVGIIMVILVIFLFILFFTVLVCIGYKLKNLVKTNGK